MISTYECLSLMIAFAILIIEIIRNNDKDQKNNRFGIGWYKRLLIKFVRLTATSGFPLSIIILVYFMKKVNKVWLFYLFDGLLIFF